MECSVGKDCHRERSEWEGKAAWDPEPEQAGLRRMFQLIAAGEGLEHWTENQDVSAYLFPVSQLPWCLFISFAVSTGKWEALSAMPDTGNGSHFLSHSTTHQKGNTFEEFHPVSLPFRVTCLHVPHLKRSSNKIFLLIILCIIISHKKTISRPISYLDISRN